MQEFSVQEFNVNRVDEILRKLLSDVFKIGILKGMILVDGPFVGEKIFDFLFELLV
jgi:hypothetical protein